MRLDGIDTLRGFAVTVVVIYHFFVLLGLDNILSPYIHSFGLLGVPLFFIISSYLIYMSIDNNIKKRGAGDGIKNYFIHRVFRILPAYYFNLFIVLLIASFSISNDFLYSQEFKSQLLSHLTLTSYFTHKAVGLGVNGAYWTLKYGSKPQNIRNAILEIREMLQRRDTTKRIKRKRIRNLSHKKMHWV